MSEHPRAQRARELGNLPVRIVKGQHGSRIYIGDNEFEHPISRGSIVVTPGPSKRMNLMTLTLVVGDVTVENAEPMLGVTKGLPGLADNLTDFIGHLSGEDHPQ